MTNAMILVLKLLISPFLDSDVPSAFSYGIYISQFIRFAGVSSKAEFNACNKTWTANLLITLLVNCSFCGCLIVFVYLSH